MRNRPAAGFTIIEMLVAVAIIGVLAGLMLVAVQTSRTIARAAQCTNNLRQLGLAAQGFESAHGRFPPGYLGPIPQGTGDSWSGQWTGCLVFLLPYLELKHIQDPIDTDKGAHAGVSLLDLDRVGDPYWQRDQAWITAQTRIAALICPEDDPYTSQNTFIRMHYFHDPERDVVGCVGGMFSNAEGNALGRTNYLGVAGAIGRTGHPDWDGVQGVFANRSRKGTNDVRDGLSTTLLFGEVTGKAGSGEDAVHYGFAWFGCGTMCTGWGFSQDDWPTFNSGHSGVVHFCYADGSVRPMAKTTDRDALISLSGTSEGTVVGIAR
jgi:prepilin-type N-terminal cleavage/methylation domain-containing protein/prepilin-type processing-associated H-X9-DG protein